MAFLSKLVRGKCKVSEQELSAPFQLLLLKPHQFDSTRASVNVVYIARNLSHVLDIDMEESHRLCVDVSKQGVAVLGTWTKKECMEMEQRLQQLEIMCRSIPAPVDGGGIVVMGEEHANSNNKSPTKTTSSKKATAESPEPGTKTEKERIPDIYDAYAHRMVPTTWANDSMFETNVASMDKICMMEFCLKYRVPKSGTDAGKIKLQDKPTPTAPKFSPTYSSDKNGQDYGKYCRSSLVRYRPWIGTPFGNGEDEPCEEDCIVQWEEFCQSLVENECSIPYAFLPSEVKEERKSESNRHVQQVDTQPQANTEDIAKSAAKSSCTQYSFNIGGMSYSYTPSEKESTMTADDDTVDGSPTKRLGLFTEAERSNGSLEKEDYGDKEESRDEPFDYVGVRYQRSRSTSSTNTRQNSGSQSFLCEV